jgi:hypothetical protein
MGRLLRRVLSGRLACKPPWTAIYLGTTLPQPSSGLPGNETSSLIVSCLTLLRTRFTEPTGSPRPLVVSYTTVSPLPPVARRRSAFCGTVSRVTPGGCYPPSCSVEPGRSSASCHPWATRMTRPSCRPIPSLSLSFTARTFYSPDSSFLTRIAPLSGQSTTSSGAEARMTCRSDSVSFTLLPIETPRTSSAAPTPYLARCFS